MDAEPPLDYLLDTTGGPAAGREELLGIVARSHSRRNRLVGVGMAVTLVVGAAGGWLAGAGSGRSSGGAALAAGPTTTALAPGAPLAPGAVAGGSRSAVASGGPNLTKAFVRTTADGVTIRGYQQAPAAPLPVIPGCPGFPGLVAEVSTADVAGQASGFLLPGTAPVKGFALSFIGFAEGAPVWVVTVETDAAAAQVRVTFPDGKTDQMAPVKGSAALAHLAPAGTVGWTTSPMGSVAALDGTGKVIATTTFPSPAAPGTKITPAPGLTVVVPGSSGGSIATSPAQTAVAPPPVPATSALVPTTVPAGSSRSAPLATLPGSPCVVMVPPPLPATTTTVAKGG